MNTRIPLFLCAALLAAEALPAPQTSPGAGPVIVLDTARGVIEFETYPEDAPKTVTQILGLVKAGFYDGLRFHRGDPKFGLVQIGDPQSRNMLMRAQEGVREIGTGKTLTSPFRSGYRSTNSAGYSPGSGCPRSCFRIAALATDFAEK